MTRVRHVCQSEQSRGGRLLALAIALVLAISGCTHLGEESLLGRWRDSAGQVLPDGSGADTTLVIRTFEGKPDCVGGSAIYLELAWPVGSKIRVDSPTYSGGTRFFLRGGTDQFGAFDADSSLPASAVNTGFNLKVNSVSVDDSGRVYVTRSNGLVERWPRTELGCA